MVNGSTYHLALRDIAEHAALKGVSVYLVGGVVRDLVRGVQPGDGDIDVMVVGDGIAFAHSLAQRIGGKVKEFPSFLTAKIIAPLVWPAIEELDIASARGETYDRPGALPRVSPGSLDDDLMRRDFTINAMAVSVPDIVTSELFSRGGSLTDIFLCDPTNGKEDLKKGLVRVLHPQSFVDDPTRLFRAARYASRIEGSFESTTARLASEAVSSGAVRTLSLVRVMNELVKLSYEPHSAGAIRHLASIGMWERSGLPFESTLESLEKTHTRLSQALRCAPEVVSTTFIRAMWARWVPEPAREGFLTSLQTSKKARGEILNLFSREARTVPLSSMSTPEVLWRALIDGGSELEAVREGIARGVFPNDA